MDANAIFRFMGRTRLLLGFLEAARPGSTPTSPGSAADWQALVTRSKASARDFADTEPLVHGDPLAPADARRGGADERAAR